MTASVSVVMATFNGAPYLSAQLQSIAGQTRVPDEIWIGDDGSTDDTLQIAERFRDGGLPIQIVRQAPQLGSTRNFESLLPRCTGDVVLFSDQDDVWHPGRVARSVAELQSHPSAPYVFSDARIVDEAGKAVGTTLFSGARFADAEQEAFNRGEGWRVLLRRNVVTGATLAVRRGALLAVLPIAAGWVHDAWIAWILEATTPGRIIREPLIDYRRHSAQQIGAFVPTLSGALAWLQRPRADGFEAEADAHMRLLERLKSTIRTEHARNAAMVVAAIERKVAFLRRRAATVRARLMRPLLLGNPARLTDYREFALGWRSLVVDALSVR
ncbi:MAG: glycosyltransferase family 2 protein [Deltaproteobacteria bacterium]|nr:glycosyltransferase family 2 protein [Deltaproteobacteria bacterium]